MLEWALTFLLIALISGLLGFTVPENDAAKVCFLIFLILFIVCLCMGRKPYNPEDDE
jgi:uncharacterized membrane protein YtjA (UPF0391 family)